MPPERPLVEQSDQDPVDVVLALAERVRGLMDQIAEANGRLRRTEDAYRTLRHWVIETHEGAGVYIESGRVELKHERRVL